MSEDQTGHIKTWEEERAEENARDARKAKAMGALSLAFATAVIGLICYGVHGCNAADARITQESNQRIAEASHGDRNTRLQEILRDQAFSTWNGNNLGDATPLRILHDQHYHVELAADLPVGAMVQINKDNIRINTHLARDTQDDLLRLATAYIDEQAKDHQEYGGGEAFTLGSGRLMQISKNAVGYEKILAPAIP